MIVACGVDNMDQVYRQAASERIAEEVFDDRFSWMMDISWESVDDSFTYFSRFTVTNGRLDIPPHNNRNIKAMMQWSRRHLMMVMIT